MKLFREVNADLNLVTAYDTSSVSINGQTYTESLVLMPDQLLTPWIGKRSLPELALEDVAVLRDLKRPVVLIGTGAKQRFPAHALLVPLIEAGIGFEIMDTGSACRTYNILASEGRNVAAALII
jgi:uncharacterized protein